MSFSLSFVKHVFLVVSGFREKRRRSRDGDGVLRSSWIIRVSQCESRESGECRIAFVSQSVFKTLPSLRSA